MELSKLPRTTKIVVKKGLVMKLISVLLALLAISFVHAVSPVVSQITEGFDDVLTNGWTIVGNFLFIYF